MIASKIIKYLSINLNMYSENCRILRKATEDDTNKWKETLCSWIRIIHIVKMSILPKAIYRIKKKKTYQNINGIFHRTTKKRILQFVWNHQRSWLAKAILKKNKAEDIMLPDLKLHYKVVCLLLSHVQLFVTPWTIACPVPPSMGFSRQEYWNGFPFPSPGDLPDTGIKPRSSALQADSLPSEL